MLDQSISVVMPAFNEEENIETAVASSIRVLEDIAADYEVIVVNDASTDRTAEILERLAQENPRVRPVHHGSNRKLGGSLKTGFSTATKGLIFYSDADNPFDMNELRKALPLLDRFDVVSGYRATREERFRRKVYSWGYNRLIRLLFGLKVRDINFSYKLIKREILDSISLQSEGSFIDAELLIETFRNGFRIGQVEVVYTPRVYGQSTLASFSVILKILEEMLRYLVRTRFAERQPRRHTAVPVAESTTRNEK